MSGDKANRMATVHHNFLTAVNTYNSTKNPKMKIRNKKRLIKALDSRDKAKAGAARVYQCLDNTL